MNSRLEVILSKLEPITESGCLVWTGAHTEGYGRVDYHGKFMRIHRLIYEHLVGPIPKGMTLDHLCKVRCCANVHHLEVVTNKENVLRGDGLSANNARKKFCKRGHPLSGENLVIMRGARQCRICVNMRYRIKYAKKQEAS